MKLLDKLKP